MVNIHLVRHAESIANMQSIYQGVSYDTPLSPRGQKQASCLADQFRTIAIDRIITSPLKRTLETARTVSRVKYVPIQTDRSIIETNHGAWEGRTKQEVMERWPHLYRKWQRFPSRVTFPDGEQFVHTQRRVIEWWRGFLSSPLTDTLVVSHDNIIRIIIAYVLNMKLNAIWKFHLQPTAVTALTVMGEGVRMRTLNDATHLKGVQADLAIHAL